jgi:hypothetical protein
MARRPLIALLALLTGFVLWAAWYGQTKGLTRKWRQLVSREFDRIGLDIQFRRLTLSPLHGFVAENVTLTNGDDRSPIATIDRMTLSVDASKALRGKPFLRSLILRGANLRMPLPPPAEATPLELRNLNANLYFPRDTLLVSNATATVHDVDISLRGTLRNLDSAQPQINKTFFVAVASILKAVREIEAERPPTLNFTFQGDLEQPDSIELTGSISGADLKFNAIPIAKLQAQANIHHNRLNLQSLLVADDAGKLEAFGDWENGQPHQFELQSNLSRSTLLAAEAIFPLPVRPLLALSAHPEITLSISQTADEKRSPLFTGRISLPSTKLPGCRPSDLSFSFAIAHSKFAVRDGSFANREERLQFALLKDGSHQELDLPDKLPPSLHILFESLGFKTR